MKIIVLDFKYFETPADVHEYLAEKLGFPAYYGRNLDALFDVLSTWSEPVKFYLFTDRKGFERGFIHVIRDASSENGRVGLYVSELPE